MASRAIVLTLAACLALAVSVEAAAQQGATELTPMQWCYQALTLLGSRHSTPEQRAALNEMARNRGCYDAPEQRTQNAKSEKVRRAVCDTVPGLLSEPGLRADQKAEVLSIARANGCIR